MVTWEELTLLYGIDICKGHNQLVDFLFSLEQTRTSLVSMLPVTADLEKLPSRG